MDYHQYHLSRMPPSYPSYAPTSGFNQYDNNRDPYYMDSYGRSIPNPLPAMFRTATMTSNTPSMSSNSNRAQPFNYRPPPPPSYNTYDTPRNYNNGMSSGYISDSNDLQRSSISVRPMGGSGSNSNVRRVGPTQPQPQPQPQPQQQQQQQRPQPQPYPQPRSQPQPQSQPRPQPQSQPSQSYYSPATQYKTRIISSNDQSYYSDSECVGSGPRYTKISRQAIPNRRPSNVTLPIRSITSKAYDEYVPPESPRSKQQPYDVYRYQQEQQERLEREQREQRERELRERERQEQMQRQLYEQQQAAARFNSQDQRRKSDSSIEHEIGAELLKSPIANKKRFADSSFFKTSFNTYPTIDEQKQMARKIASILQSGDPAQKGASKFEKQRQRAEKYTLEAEATATTLSTSTYRPVNPIQPNRSSFSNHQPLTYDTTGVPDCIKHSLDEAQHMNPLRYVGAPEEFKQRHMQEHVTHTNVPPQTAMSLVADLNNNRGKGAALFQKRKARSEKWVVDENNVKKTGYQPPPPPTHISETAKPWGQHAPSSWSGDEGPYSGPSFTPVRPKFNAPPPQRPSISESILSPPPTQNTPRYGDFNAKPKGFGSWNTENIAPQTPRSVDNSRKPENLNLEPSIREGIAESHMRTASQPWSPSGNSQALFSPTQQQQQPNDFFNFPSSNVLSKWKNQEYSPWNQSQIQDQQKSQIPMTREGVDQLRQRLAQQAPPSENQFYKQYSSFNQQNDNNANYNPYSSSSQGSGQQHHFTDL